MPDHLHCLVKMIVGSLPVKDPHAQQQQQQSIIDLHPVNYTKPFSPMDHMGPQLIIKVKVREDIIPPTMVCSCLILPLLGDPMESGLGDLQLLINVSLQEKQRERLP